jgi:4-alpha-glucanotransferase
MKEHTLYRNAGILLHITSLPRGYYVGDMGPEAYRFINFLEKSGQTWWQILPINQTDRNKAYSPYSAVSAFAGNIMLISPELLKDAGLINKLPSLNYILPKSQVDFEKAEALKNQLMEVAFDKFRNGKFTTLEKEYVAFCKDENFWLDDYALFMALKQVYNYSPWNTWEKEHKNRDKKAMNEISMKYADQIEAIKFAQFIFLKQWKTLKDHCNQKGIKILGDVPIYIGYDSADVWSYPEYFKLKANKEPLGVAGVPPDYFNEDGQLWRMPVFNWSANKKDGYKWWIERIGKNLQLFDLVRIDHFRGFSAYYEIPSNEETARNGKWIKGPGKDLFDAIEKKFPEMPFVAEDLGEIDQPVYDLRDRYHLPGMCLLEFTFGDDTPTSVHSPHNFTRNSIVYTGTHDNNTAKGWFKDETGKKLRLRMQHYIGKKITSSNVSDELIRLAYQSIAKLVIIPMQDILGLGRKARMNIPSVETGNWGWRVKANYDKIKTIRKLKKWTELFNRL